VLGQVLSHRTTRRTQSVQKWLDRLGEAPVAADVHHCCVSADTGGGAATLRHS
jgi:hypothetical protein